MSLFSQNYYRSTLLGLLLALVCLSGCNSDEQAANQTTADGLTKVTLMLNWFPEAEHGGFYAALKHGYYKEAGLEVEIIPGGPGSPVQQKVARGDVTFGVTNADDVLLARAQDADVVAVMAPLQTSPRCVMVHKSSGIENFDQLKNVTLAMSGGKAWAQFLKQTLPLDGVELQEGAAVAKFLVDENYAQQAYIFSEPFVAEQEGGDPVSLLVSELGFNPYTSLLITKQSLIDEQPELVQKMVTASIKGWDKYLAEPEETNAHIHEQNEEMGLEILAYGVEAMKPLCIVEEEDGSTGHMTVERWKTLHQQMIDVDAIEPDSVDPKKAFTTQFLQ
ncbi:MAG: ABC transporter substrate-binding protein [Planctomycetaceae bacterium]|nr:ABC transporter substrate-binding protein [bacterium]MDB4679513.1 ABC transporter substrate-binding protein [Planctomycetaceae bacterium]MDG2388147.1 ABC transporter substrate-binding protein [Planctomycetaceae bacterium]